MMIRGENSITERSNRIFVWQDRGKYTPVHVPGIGVVLQTWSARVSKTEKSEPKGPYDGPNCDLYITKAQGSRDLAIITYVWGIVTNTRSGTGNVASGYAKTREEAAEQLYVQWYTRHTNALFHKARMPARNKEVVLLGTWVTADDYHAAPTQVKERAIIVPDVATDVRDGKLFLLSWWKNKSEKAVTRIKDCTYLRRQYHHDPSVEPFDWQIELESGLKLSESLDWYIRCPEQYVEGEVFCPSCRAAIGGVQSIGMRWVRSFGAMCGPCLDKKIEVESMPDDLSDVML